MGVGIAVGPFREIAVEGVDDGVDLSLLGTGSRPLADAGSAGIGENLAADLLEDVNKTIAFNGVAHLLRSRGDGELRTCFESLVQGLAGNRGSPRNVFIRGVGATPDQPDRDFQRPAMGGGFLSQLGDGGGPVGGERAVHMRLQFREVNLDKLVEIFLRMFVYFRIGGEFLFDGSRGFHHLAAAGSLKIALHGLVIGEEGGGGPHFGAHVADGPLAGGREGAGPLPEILDDGPGAPLHSQHACHLQDDIFGGGPAVQPAGKSDADKLGHLQLPGHACHYVHRIGAAHADGNHTQSTRIGGVRIGTNHHSSRKGIILQHHLVDDPGAGFPEAYPIFVAHRFQKIKDFLVVLQGSLQIGVAVVMGQNKMVAVDC